MVAEVFLGGFGVLMNDFPGHFKMILSPENPSYQDLPGIWTLLRRSVGFAFFLLGL